MKKFVLILAAIAVVAGGLLLHRRFSGKDKIVYDYATVSRGKIDVEVSASGTIQPVNVVSVGTQVSGVIEKVYVDYNSRVAKGELIAKLETDTLQETLNSAQAAVTDTKAKLDHAKLTAKRNKDLFRQNFISRSEWEQSDLDVVTAKSNYDRALAEMKKAQKNLGYADIVSPVDGTIITKKVEEGQTVASSFQTPELFTIAEDLTKMQIEAKISEADIGQIRQDLPVSFTVDTFPNDTFKGYVSQIRLQPSEDSNVVMYTVVISISNDDLKLLPGMTAYVTIKVQEKDDILRLPNMAFQYRPVVAGRQTGKKSNVERAKIKMERQDLKPNEAFLYREVDNKPVAVKVTKGISNLLMTEIVSGLAEGDKVIMEDLTTKVSVKRGGPP